jgi:hypothetical protein
MAISQLSEAGCLLSWPSLSTMKKLAEALDADLEITLRPEHIK